MSGSGPGPAGRLFPAPWAGFRSGLEAIGKILPVIHPLRPRHRESLPRSIRHLSELLTTERDRLPRDYMARAETLAAYLHFFLPWNVLRQGRLLQGLDLQLAPGARIVDLGAGPLTFLHALLLACPGLREQELEYVGVDRAEPALKVGRALFAALAAEADCAWRVRTERRPFGAPGLPPADLLVAANLLNELEAGGRERQAERSPADQLLDRLEAGLTPRGAILLIEPGVRPAAAQLVRLRAAALERGWLATAPCPHAGECPQPGRRSGPWCHFGFDPDGVPDWLKQLARQARLPKERASLSFLLLQRPEGSAVAVAPTPVRSGHLAVRVVSDLFPLPGGRSGQYGCAEAGLILLESKIDPTRRQPPAPGDLLLLRTPPKQRHDLKSGALVVPLDEPA